MRAFSSPWWIGPILTGLISIGCGDGLEPRDPFGPRQTVRFDERTTLGFSVSEIPELGVDLDRSLIWQSGRSGFDGEPSTGETKVHALLSYDGGRITAVGSPVWKVEAELVLLTTTADGALDEQSTCTLYATSQQAWICSSETSDLRGSFRVTRHPPGDLLYDVWMSRRNGALSGGVSGVVQTMEQLSAESSTGTSTGYGAGVWSDDGTISLDVAR